MSNRSTVIRSLHNLGTAAWFGSSLMNAVGLNGASQDGTDPDRPGPRRRRLGPVDAGERRRAQLGARRDDRRRREVSCASWHRTRPLTPDDVAKAQPQRVLQWVTPALNGALVELGAQQRPSEQPAGARKKIRDRARGS